MEKTWLYFIQYVTGLMIVIFAYYAFKANNPQKRAKNFALWNLTLGIFLFTMGFAKITPETKAEDISTMTNFFLLFGFANFFIGSFLLYRSKLVPSVAGGTTKEKSPFPVKKKKKRK